MVRQSNGSAGASIQCECPQGVEPCRSISALRTALTVATPSLPRDPAKVPSPSHLRTLLIVAKPAADSRLPRTRGRWRAWLGLAGTSEPRAGEAHQRAPRQFPGGRAGLRAGRKSVFPAILGAIPRPSPALPDARPSPRPWHAWSPAGQGAAWAVRASGFPAILAPEPIMTLARGYIGRSHRSELPAARRDPASLDPSY